MNAPRDCIDMEYALVNSDLGNTTFEGCTIQDGAKRHRGDVPNNQRRIIGIMNLDGGSGVEVVVVPMMLWELWTLSGAMSVVFSHVLLVGHRSGDPVYGKINGTCVPPECQRLVPRWGHGSQTTEPKLQVIGRVSDGALQFHSPSRSHPKCSCW